MVVIELLYLHLPAFLLILCRIGAFFAVAPLFSFAGVPAQFKIGIAFFVSLLTFFTFGTTTSVTFGDDYILSVIREVLVGILLGFIAYLFFTVVQVAGSFVDLQMGFAVVNVIDPVTGAQSPILGNFKFVVAILLFLAMNGHHYFIAGIMESYRWVPLENEWFARLYDGSVTQFLIASFATMFELAFKMAAPLIVALFLADVALGMLARTAPQFNIFVVGIPFKILLGFFVFFIMIGSFLYLFQELFQTLLQSLQEMLLILQGGS